MVFPIDSSPGYPSNYETPASTPISAIQRITAQKLTVSEISKNERGEVLETLQDWKSLIDTKRTQTTNFKQLSNSESMRNSLEMSVKVAMARNSDPSEKPLLVCRDEHGVIQSIALTEKKTDGLFVSYLATHPNNLDIDINKGIPGRVRGASSLILAHCAQTVANANNQGQVRLVAVEGSHKFYEKLGFETPGPFNPSDFFLTTTRCKELARRFFTS